MKNEIFEASELLYDKFKVKPVNTKLFLHHDIKKFLKNTKNPNAQSIFMPSDMSAHVPENRIDLLFHEYHAHGLYCEQVYYGKKMVDDENKVDIMSEQELLDALSIHEYIKPTFEAHALWTEDFLLRRLNKEQILEERLDELKYLNFYSKIYPKFKTYKNIYDSVKKFELNNGIYETWYSFGFSRIFDDSILIDIVKEKLKERFNDLVFLIHFGSSNPESDIDLCAVLNDNVNVDEYNPKIIDFSQFNYSDFLNKIKLFDIPITQPLLTGRLVYGNKNKFNELKNNLIKQDITNEALNYMIEKSNWCFNYAVNCFNKKCSNYLDLTLNNLTYAISYNNFRDRYKDGKRIVKFSDLNDELLLRLRNYQKLGEKGELILGKDRVKEFIKEVKIKLNIN